MKGLLLLATRHLLHWRLRTALLVCAFALAFLLPIAVHLLVRSQGARMQARAAATPFIVGAPGSRYDLVLSSLYFRGRTPAATQMDELETIERDDRGLAIPILARHTARGQPLVGTTPDYARQRGLVARVGTLPALLGEATVGARAAEALRVDVGATLLTDGPGVFERSLAYPLTLSIVGVLAPTGTPDDEIVLVSLETVWAAEGHFHGHAAVEDLDPERIRMRRPDGSVDLDAGVEERTVIRPEDLATFHLHGERGALPLTAILVYPHDERTRAILEGRYAAPTAKAQWLETQAVVDEILGFVAALKRFFDANTRLVGLSTALLLALVIMLTLAARKREMTTLARIGVPRSRIAAMIGFEFLALLLVAALLAAAGGWLVSLWLSRSTGLAA